MKILYLSVKKEPFDVMHTGEKKEEFRKFSDWIYSRLIDKEGNARKYDVIKFTQGYGNKRPYFICKWEGFLLCYMPVAERKYSNGFTVSGYGKGDFIIYCGQIIEKGYLKH